MTRPPTTADSKMPLPVADSKLNTYSAASAVGLGTTGGTFSISLCRPSIANLGAKRPLSQVLVVGRPQANTNTVRMTQGVQALSTAARSCWVGTWASPAWPPSCSWPLSDTLVQISAGFHTLRKSTRAAIEQIAAITSTNSG